MTPSTLKYEDKHISIRSNPHIPTLTIMLIPIELNTQLTQIYIYIKRKEEKREAIGSIKEKRERKISLKTLISKKVLENQTHFSDVWCFFLVFAVLFLAKHSPYGLPPPTNVVKSTCDI